MGEKERDLHNDPQVMRSLSPLHQISRGYYHKNDDELIIVLCAWFQFY